MKIEPGGQSRSTRATGESRKSVTKNSASYTSPARDINDSASVLAYRKMN